MTALKKLPDESSRRNIWRCFLRKHPHRLIGNSHERHHWVGVALRNTPTPKCGPLPRALTTAIPGDPPYIPTGNSLRDKKIENTIMNSRRKSIDTIRKILEETKTIAVVGFSSRPSKAGYYVPAYLQEHGYRVIPVNPYLEEALGEKAFANLASIPDPVDLVQIFRRSEAVPPFVEQAIAIGVKAVWMQQGIINEEAAESARAAGLDLVMDRCLMVEHRKYK